MNKEIIGLSRALAIMAVMGWFSDTLASVALHRGWWSLIPAFCTLCCVVLATELYVEAKKA